MSPAPAFPVSNQVVQAPQSTPTVTIVQVVTDDPSKELGMIDVSVAAFGLIGVIMIAAVAAGLLAGVLYICTDPGAPSPSSRRGATNTTCSGLNVPVRPWWSGP